jgi:hypothetical protein
MVQAMRRAAALACQYDLERIRRTAQERLARHRDVRMVDNRRASRAKQARRITNHERRRARRAHYVITSGWNIKEFFFHFEASLLTFPVTSCRPF